MRAPDHLNALRAVEAAARHQSFALAAQELNVTSAAVGQLVRRLEESLGVDLFHRSQAGPARLVMTEAAQAAISDLQAGFASLAAAMERLKSARKRQSLAVTVPSAFADKWLLHRLDAFSRDHPDCELRIDTSTALVDFATQAVDVGIRYGAGVWPRLVAFPFARDGFFPVCSPALLDGDDALRAPADLEHHPLIHDTSMATTSAFPSWRDWYLAAGLPLTGSERGSRVNDSAAAYRMAMAGHGVALGRTTLVEADLTERRLVRPFGPALECSLAYYVVCRPQDAEDPTIRAFRDWLVQQGGASGKCGRFLVSGVCCFAVEVGTTSLWEPRRPTSGRSGHLARLRTSDIHSSGACGRPRGQKLGLNRHSLIRQRRSACRQIRSFTHTAA